MEPIVKLTLESVISLAAIIGIPTGALAVIARAIVNEIVPKGRRRLVETITSTVLSGFFTFIYAVSYFLLTRENIFLLLCVWMAVATTAGIGIFKIPRKDKTVNPPSITESE